MKVPGWLKGRQRRLQRRISRSMRDSWRPTLHCRDLQRRLAGLNRVERVLRRA